MFEVSLLIVAIGLCWFLTWRVRAYALSRDMLDRPNARSSHREPTPRGGGLAIVATIGVGLMALSLQAIIRADILMVYSAGVLTVALAGYLDDKHSLSVLPRLSSHILAAAFMIVILLGWDGAQLPLAWLPAWTNWALLGLGVIWSINLFNFMDGIDGLATSEALFVSTGAAVLLMINGCMETPWLAVWMITAGSCLGFLVWNWPPAKIFMGDVGSGFLGFWIAGIALAQHVAGVLSLWTSVALGSLFVADATATLIRRVLGGERWHEAHRTHAYQHLARRWHSHLRVTGLAWVINLAIVLPAAYASVVWDDLAPLIAGTLLLALSVACLVCGAGSSSK